MAFRPCFAAGLVFYITVDEESFQIKIMSQCGIRQLSVKLLYEKLLFSNSSIQEKIRGEFITPAVDSHIVVLIFFSYIPPAMHCP